MGLVERHTLRSLSARLSRWQKIALGLFISFVVIYGTSPYDSSLRAFFRFQKNVVTDYYQSQLPSDGWLYRKQPYPIDPNRDIGLIIKTGYGTKHRMPLALQALKNESFSPDILVVQDFPVIPEQKHYNVTDDKGIEVVDILGWNLGRGALKGREHLERIYKYKNLADAVDAEEWALSEGLGRAIGWELDAMKFLPALEYAWNTLPKKKWYVMIDDDTYVIKSTLSLLLGHLNFGQPHYLGNPVGDFKGRFPHGGSSVILSGAALRNLFEWHPEIVAQANLDSPFAIWGDKLLATTLMKIAVYLDESYRRVFNGEHPWMTRIWSDRLCLPIMGFHGLGNKVAMEQVGETFKDQKGPVLWSSLAKIYGVPDYQSFIDAPIRPNMNYVGRLDERSTTVEDVASPEHCLDICGHSPDCLAWFYDPNNKRCDFAPWAILGDMGDGRFSGINGKLGKRLLSRCHTPS